MHVRSCTRVLTYGMTNTYNTSSDAQVNHERVFALGDVAGPAAVQGPEAAGAAFPNTAQVRCCAAWRATLCLGTHEGHLLLPCMDCVGSTTRVLVT